MLRTIIEGDRFIVIHDYSHINDSSRDHTSIGGIDIPHYENLEYEIFINDVNTAVNAGPLIMSIFTDASGTVFVKDSNNNDINMRKVISNSYTYPYYNSEAVYIAGEIKLIFDDGSTFSNSDSDDVNDNDDNYGLWYYIQGVSDMNNLHKFT
jgi:hypothetical protein